MRNYAGPTLDDLFSEMDARMAHLETELASMAGPSGAVAHQPGAFTASTSDLTHLSHPIDAPAAEPPTEAGFEVSDPVIGVGKAALMHGILIATGLDEVVSGLLGTADGPAQGTFVDATPTDPTPDGDCDRNHSNSISEDHDPGQMGPSADFLDDFMLARDTDKD